MIGRRFFNDIVLNLINSKLKIQAVYPWNKFFRKRIYYF
jgi:hypothetical protein